MAVEFLENFVPEDPCVISRGEFKLGPTDFVYLGEPMEVDTSLGTSGVDATDQNKRWVKRYSATDSSTVTVGVAIENKLNKGHAAHKRSGLGGFRRDIKMLQWGLVPMYNAGAAACVFKDRVAPYYDSSGGYAGFKKWVEGEVILGYMWQSECPAGHKAMVFIDVAATPANTTAFADLSDTTISTPSAGEILKYHAVNGWENAALNIADAADLVETSVATGDVLVHDGSTYVNGTYKTIETQSVTTHVHTLAADTMLFVLSVFANVGTAAGVELVPAAGAPAAGQYQITGTGTTITTNATDAISEIVVTYIYDVNG